MDHTNVENGIKREELNSETALINWHDLQTYFAAGQVIGVSTTINLIDVAKAIAEDDKDAVASWMGDNLVSNVSDDQALQWFESNTPMWAVVARPFVLVQENQKANNQN